MLNLFPIATVAADTLGSAIDLVDYEGEIVVALDCSAGVSDDTCACKLKESATSGGSYTDVAGGAFTGVTTTASAEKLSLQSNEMMRFVKLDIDVGGTLHSFLISAKIYGIKKSPA